MRFVLAVGIGIGQVLLDSWVFMVLWAWFVVPFFRVHELTMVSAIGISCIVSLMTTQYVPVPPEKAVEFLLVQFRRPLVLLAIGFVAKGF